MTSGTQAFVSLVIATVIGASAAGLDAFIFHQFGIWFDEMLLGSIMVSLGVHWIGVGNLPPLTLRAPGNVPPPPPPGAEQ